MVLIWIVAAGLAMKTSGLRVASRMDDYIGVGQRGTLLVVGDVGARELETAALDDFYGMRPWFGADLRDDAERYAGFAEMREGGKKVSS